LLILHFDPCNVIMNTKFQIIVFLFCILPFTIFGNEKTPDDIFLESFNLRYSNPQKGIAQAMMLEEDSPQLAYLSLAYNYYYLSNYDSSFVYLNKITQENELFYNMAQTCRGLIDQRLGKYFQSFSKLFRAQEFYEKKLYRSKYRNDKILTQGFVENAIGKISLEYNYLGNFEELNKSINDLNAKVEHWKLPLTNDQRVKIAFMEVQNYLTNSPNETNQRIQNKSILELLNNCIKYSDSTSYYQLGILFEVLGFYYGKLTNEYLTFINENKTNPFVIGQIKTILNESTNVEFGFYETSLGFFRKHGDAYQISSAYENLARTNLNILQGQISDGKPIDTLLIVSIRGFIDSALYYHHFRKPEFFKRLAWKQNLSYEEIDEMIGQLQSVTWYIETLKLKNSFETMLLAIKSYPDDVKVAILKEIACKEELIQKLEKKHGAAANDFFTELQDLTKKQEKQRRINLILIFFTVTIILFLILGFIYFYRRRIRKEYEKSKTERFLQEQKAKVELERWNTIYEGLLQVKEKVLDGSSESFKETLQPISVLIGELFDAEYCAIGIADDKLLTNIASYCKKELSTQQLVALEKRSAIPIGNTIIGQLLYTKESYKAYAENNIPDKSEHLEFYKDFLVSGSIKNIRIVGLYEEKEYEKIPLGYLSFLNVYKPEPYFKDSIVKLAHQLSSIILDEKNRKSYLNRIHDEKFINGLIGEDLTIGEVIQRSMNYIAEQFDAGIVSFRVPVLNGSDEENDENLLFVLRNKFVNNNIPQKEEIRKYYDAEKKILTLRNVTYSESLKSNFPGNIFWDEQGQDKGFYDTFELEDFFKTKTNIILPIKKALNHTVSNNEKINTYWNSLYGFFNLQPIKIEDKAELEKRLAYIAGNISIIFYDIINRKKQQQINLLHTEINRLDYTTPKTFYNQIAQLIKKVINAATCSVFIYNKLNNHLELKATTAKNASYKGEGILLENIKFIEDIYFERDNENSFVVKTLLNNMTYILYDLHRHPDISRNFIEHVDGFKDEDYSWLFVPLKDTQGKSIGVIKCLGTKKTDENLIYSFWDFDRTTIEFIAALASRFIENAQLGKEKDNFVKQMVHETLSPITEMMHISEEFFNRMERQKSLPKEFTTYRSKLMNNILLQKSIILGLNDATMLVEGNIQLSLSYENVRKLILDVVGLMEESALFEKGITIKTYISDIPYLRVDRYKMQQVFINLLKNAINYSDDNTSIGIYYKRIEEGFENEACIDWHEIKFQNFGIGINEQEKENIFLPYKRGSNASEKIPSGSGIGLFLVKHIIEAHGGLCIIRNLNNPTEISVLLPAIQFEN